MGDPPPMDSYAAIDFGARRFEIRYAIVFWRGARGGGRRIMSGSANRLYRNLGNGNDCGGGSYGSYGGDVFVR